MFRVLLLAVALAPLFGCASDPQPMRTGIAPNSRYHPPDPTRPVASSSNPAIVGESAWQSEAAKWIGAPYRIGGDTREGMDALGLIRRMYENVARIHIPWDLRELSRTGVAIPPDQLRPGDIIFFGNRTDRVYVGGDRYVDGEVRINGAGIYIGGNRFVEATPTFGVVYADLKGPQFSQDFRTARRILR
jgi:cell wall-associated NlpC family hydrolase